MPYDIAAHIMVYDTYHTKYVVFVFCCDVVLILIHADGVPSVVPPPCPLPPPHAHSFHAFLS